VIPTSQPSIVMPLDREGVIQYICPDDTFRAIREVIEDQEYRIRRELRQKGQTA